MFRSFFLYLSKAAWARQMITGFSPARRMAGRFVAGDRLDEALQVIARLNANGILATLDHLGENTTTPAEALQAVQDILAALDGIAANRLRANVSIKLTQIGLRLDEKLCAENLAQIARCAAGQGNFVRVDMEDAAVTQTTLDMVLQARQQGLTNLGVVIQSYLYRSLADVKMLAAQGVSVRLCKGAYKEPESVAFPRKAEVDQNYDQLTAVLLEGVAQRWDKDPQSISSLQASYAALATHDPRRIQFAIEYAKRRDLPKQAMEFQMLYGIRRDLQERLAAEGYPVRVYVPYGTQWYPYFMRRLGERPANVWFILSNLLRR